MTCKNKNEQKIQYITYDENVAGNLQEWHVMMFTCFCFSTSLLECFYTITQRISQSFDK